MEDQIAHVYGPHTLHLSRFGFLTRLFLRLFVWTTYVHDTPEGVVVYKKLGNTMYILGAARKASQSSQSDWS